MASLMMSWSASAISLSFVILSFFQGTVIGNGGLFFLGEFEL
jgi:hypothetical protein